MIRKQLNNLSKAANLGWPFALIMALFLTACSDTKNAKPKGVIVAETAGCFLTENELIKVFGKDWKSKEDKVNDFIRIWAKDKVIAKEAENALSDKEKDFSNEIISYKNSLLKYAYEKNLVLHVRI